MNGMINLSTDTSTPPTPGMLHAMYDAEEGEQSSSGFIVNRLLRTVADLLGKEAALFLPTGTMCNRIAMAVHCPSGGGMLVDTSAHVLHAEGGGYAQAGLVAHRVLGKQGIYSLEQLAQARVEGNRYAPGSHLLWVEQSVNLGGGTCWPIEVIREVGEYAKMYRIASHMAGARLMNAVVATGVSARDFAAPFDSVWLGLSKGLGAPFGAVLAGSHAFIQEAIYLRQTLGGDLHKLESIAAAGLYALEHHVLRLAEDHEHARLLASGLSALGFKVLATQTNIVLFDVSLANCSALYMAEELKNYNIQMFSHVPSLGYYTLRAVTHLGIRREHITATLEAVEHVMQEIPAKKREAERRMHAQHAPGWNED